jgi:nicotinamidase-related amidase
MKKKNALLIIDPQYDFCDPAGALYVKGADRDMELLAGWIKANRKMIDHIAVTMDSHPVNDISHPSFWQDNQGNFPPPFTPITLQDIRSGRWMPRYFSEEAERYVEELERQGEFGHFIWPYHCLTGSAGASIYGPVMDVLIDWSADGKQYQAIIKGTNPLTEHFGVFRANIPIPGSPETELNRSLIDGLMQYENVFLAGEARSHCVANSMKQAMDEAPGLVKKFIVLEDCMSDVEGLGHLGDPVFDRAKKLGIRFERASGLEL